MGRKNWLFVVSDDGAEVRGAGAKAVEEPSSWSASEPVDLLHEYAEPRMVPGRR
jgi:hypothetical protein